MAGRFAPQVPAKPDAEVLFKTRPDFKSSLDIVADHIARAAVIGEPASSMTFAVYGEWGAGKSTALQLIEHEIKKKVEAAGGNGTVTWSYYHAPLWEGFPDARMSLAEAIITGLAPETRTDMVEVLRSAAGKKNASVATEEELEMRNTVDFYSALREMSPAPPLLEVWLLKVAKKLGSDGAKAQDDAPRIHVVLIDDLDRCSADFTVELLAATTFWSAVENLFFVIAARERHLLASLEARLPAGAQGPEEALEKYVHLGVEVPPLLTRPAEIAAYLTRLVKDVFGTTGADPARDELTEIIKRCADEFETKNGSVFAPLLWPEMGLTPRKLKHRFNRLLAELKPQTRLDPDGAQAEAEPQAGLDPDVVKGWVIHAFWPEFWDRYLLNIGTPDLLGEREWEARVQLVERLTNIGAILRPLWDLDRSQLASTFSNLAQREGVDPEADPRLAIYLALDPPWQRPPTDVGIQRIQLPPLHRTLQPGEPSFPGEEEAERAGPDGEPGGPEPLDVPLLHILQADQAMARGDRVGALRELTELRDKARRGASASAATLGNAALRADRLDDVDLALELHQAALRTDPNHFNVMQNFVEFVIDRHLSEYYPQVEKLLERLQTDGWGHKPERTQVLTARLESALGGSRASLATTSEELLEQLVQKPSFDALLSVYELILETGDRRKLRRACRAVAEVAEGLDIYRVLRLLADGLAASDERSDEAEAADIYRFVLAKGLACATPRGRATDVKHNLATLFASMDFDGLAKRLWTEAYHEDPRDPSIRQAFAAFLNNLGQSNAASIVLLGQELEELPIPEEELPEHFSDTEYWWERLDIPSYPPCPSFVTAVPV